MRSCRGAGGGGSNCYEVSIAVATGRARPSLLRAQPEKAPPSSTARASSHRHAPPLPMHEIGGAAVNVVNGRKLTSHRAKSSASPHSRSRTRTCSEQHCRSTAGPPPETPHDAIARRVARSATRLPMASPTRDRRPGSTTGSAAASRATRSRAPDRRIRRRRRCRRQGRQDPNGRASLSRTRPRESADPPSACLVRRGTLGPPRKPSSGILSRT